MIRLFCVLFLLASSAVDSFAATKCIRAGATGSGTGDDWTNAYTNYPTLLVRGNTYYVADGSYGEKDLNVPPSGTLLITIKKATEADHGPDTGWSSTFGDGQAIMAGKIDIDTDYWLIDGNSAPGYGFKFTSSAQYQVEVGPNTDHITMRSITMDCAGAGVQNSGGISTLSGSDELLFEYIEIWDCDGDPIATLNTDDTIFSHMYIHTRSNGGFGSHADAWFVAGGNRQTLRYSRIDWAGQQLFFHPTGGGTWPTTFHVYGNRFYGGPTNGQAVKTQSGNGVMGPVNVFNNTFDNLSVGLLLGSNTSGVVKNNIFLNSGSPSFGGASHNYNWFKTGLSTQGEANAQTGSDPFVASGSENFALVSATAAGDSSIGALYNTDPNGVTRGADGVWDRGALEFGGAAPTPTPSPSPTPTPTPSPTPTPVPDSTRFQVGDRVQVYNTSAANVRATPNGTILGTQAAGALGTITGGGIQNGGNYWWQVNYDVNPDGYSVEDFLTEAPPAPTPTPTPTPEPAPNPPTALRFAAPDPPAMLRVQE